MASVDTAWLRMEQPTNPMVITGLLWLREPVDRGRLEQVVRERLVERFPRLRQRVVSGEGLAGAAYWEPAPGFDVVEHFHREELPAAGGEAALRERVCQLMSQGLDMARPPWALYLLEQGGSQAVLLARIHHCIGDGLSLARVLLSLVDGGSEEGFASEPSQPGHPLVQLLGGARKAAGLARTAWRRGAELISEPILLGDLAREGLRTASAASRLVRLPPEPPSPFRSPLTGAKRAAWSSPVAVQRLKAMGRSTGSTVNDVVLAALAGALRRYLQARGMRAQDLRAAVPVNLRPLDEPVPRELGNRFGLVFLSLPLEAESPAQRLTLLRQRMEVLKRSPEALVVLGALSVAGRVPLSMERAMVDVLDKRVSLVVTNVPGPRHPIALAGSAVERALFWVPQTANVGLGVSLFSLDGQLSLGVAADEGCVPEPEAIVTAFEEELQALERVDQ
jgi:diacylglycerol O-acyltransferase / wax synthase